MFDRVCEIVDQKMDRNEALSLLRSGADGVSKWNQRRSKGDPIPNLEKADLTKAELTGVNFSSQETEIVNLKGAIFREANLQNADLSGSFLLAANFDKANLNCATFQKTNLTGAILTGGNFRGATLPGAILLRAKVAGADFRDADLQDADLRHVEGFYTDQLAGASVSGAKLPDEVKTFAALDTIEKACADAQIVFLAMLLGCVYTVLTIGTTTDARLITNSSSSPLPIIGTQIPIIGFYVVAPIILFGFYLYFHLCMENVWERLGTLPAVLPDGRHLDKAADPWLLVGLVQSHFTRLRTERTFLSYVQAAVSFFLAWCAVPLTLFFLWVRFLRAHDWLWAGEHLLVLAGSVSIWIYTYRKAVFALTNVRQRPFSFENIRHSMRREGVLCTVSVLLLCSLVTYASVQGRILNANIDNADVSTKPEGWTGDPSKERTEILQVKPADLAGANLRNAHASGAFLARANLQGADLRNADLRQADLRRADLVEADLRGTDLRGANLSMADLGETTLTKEQVSEACFDGGTKLPEIKGFARSKYSPPPSCDRLWGPSR
jgi:uncharacterized protein YjbI with pentapeptide repeats